MIDAVRVGKAIAQMRRERHMTQHALAAELHVSHQAVSKWENGVALPDIQTALFLSRLFGISMEQLLQVDLDAAE